ncbi:MAG: hypothetical protein JWR19_3877, partial [Pedosphaera sp.]|nr:hypothetical protein [Pedosphaera sp.]
MITLFTDITKPARLWFTALISLACFSVATTVHAATQTWNDGSANYLWNNTSLNWGGSVWTDGNDAVFGATGVGAITVSGTRVVGNLTNTVSGYSFSGGTLSLAHLTATDVWNIGSGINLTNASDLTVNFTGGSTGGSFSKAGTGQLTLAGNISVTGVNATTGSTFSVDAGTLTLNGSSSCNFTNARLKPFVSGANAVTISGGTHS